MTIFLALFAVFCLFILFKAVVVVPQGFQYTLERFGEYKVTLKPGLRLIKPLVEKIGSRINMKENFIEVPSQDVITKDNAMVRADGVIFYQIFDAAKAAYGVTEMRDAIVNLTMTNIRTVMGSMDLDELLSHREKINQRLLAVVDDATTPWGIKVVRIELKDIVPPKDLVDTMAGQMKAERLKRAQILDAEADRQSQILAAEGVRNAKILTAEGEKQARVLAAEAREREASAEAMATKVVSDAITKGNVQAINYFVARAYVEAIKTMGTAENQKVIFMPLESSHLIGAIGGITELVKESVTKQQE